METQEPLELRKYELLVIFSGLLTEIEYEKELTELRKLLQEATKGISYESSWGRRDFAYRFRKQSSGYYAIFNFAALPNALMELGTTIKLNPHVLRHLMIALPDGYEPGHENDLVIPLEKEKTDEYARPAFDKTQKIDRAPRRKEPSLPDSEPKAKVAGPEDEEKLKSVEKKLEKILENPDIDIT